MPTEPLTPEEEAAERAFILGNPQDGIGNGLAARLLATLDAEREAHANESRAKSHTPEPPPGLREALAQSIRRSYHIVFTNLAHKADTPPSGLDEDCHVIGSIIADHALADPGVRAALGALSKNASTNRVSTNPSGDGLRAALDRADVLALIDQEEP